MTYSNPNSLDYQKHGLELHKNQVDLAKSRADLMGKEPGTYNAEIGLIDDFQQGNQTRKPGWRALLDGMASGLKYNLKSAEGEKKRATYANMEKMLSGFEEVGRQLHQQNERNRRRQEDMETKVIPSAIGYLTYLQSSPSYDEAFNNLNSRVEQIKTVMGFDGELVALNPRNYEVGIFKDRKTGKIVETPISSLLPPDLLKARPDLNTYERAQDAQKLSIAKQHADADTMRAKTAADYAPIHAESRKAYAQNIQNTWNPQSQYERGFGVTQGKEDAKRLGELEEENLSLEDRKWKIKELQDMVKSGKVITGKTVVSWLARMTGKQLNTESMSETEAFDALSKNLLEFVKGDVKFGNMNQKEFEWLTRQTPESTMTRGGIERILNRLESSLDRAMSRNEAEMRRRPDFRHAPAQGDRQGESPPIQDTASSLRKIQIVDPQTGAVAKVLEKDRDAAIAGGWEVKENG